jgi:hypothetical protein
VTRVCFVLVCVLLALARVCAAQSNAPDAPTPVTTNEISGSIAPLDVGDPRQTRHFYTFGARQGDLELTVEANNLEGDIDLFSSAAMRPLAKVTLYAGINATVSRTVFFRREETVILRIQARSANDADGTYRIRFGGTFVASTAPAPVQSSSAEMAKSNATSARPADRNVRRVNSVGARIEEPKVEVAETPAPVPSATVNTPAPVAAKTPPTRTPPARGRAAARRTAARTGTTQQNSTQPAATAGEPANAPTTSNADRNTANSPTNNSTGNDTARTTNSRASATRNRANRQRTPRANASGAANRSTTTDSTTANASPTNTAPASDASPNESGANAAGTTSSASATALGLEAPGSRIVLELRDGTRVVREMSEVRRVAIEGRLVVIVLKNGRVERQPLANVQRMSIEP